MKSLRARRAKQPSPGAEAPGKWKRIDGAPEGAALFKLRKGLLKSASAQEKETPGAAPGVGSVWPLVVERPFMRVKITPSLCHPDRPRTSAVRRAGVEGPRCSACDHAGIREFSRDKWAILVRFSITQLPNYPFTKSQEANLAPKGAQLLSPGRQAGCSPHSLRRN
jgi:hypothetical protein